jgi:hypothetical protein
MVILFLAGLVFAAVGVYGSRRQLLLRRKGQRVTGTVTRIDRQWDPGGGPNNPGGYVYYPVLDFQTTDGQHVETRSSVGGSNREGAVGQPVPVIYDPANPSVAEVGTFGAQATALLLPLICAAAGIGLLIAGIVTAIGS